MNVKFGVAMTAGQYHVAGSARPLARARPGRRLRLPVARRSFRTRAGDGDGRGRSALEGWTALAALAQATERVRLGILVTGNTYRHPAVLAKMATTVDHISNGRLEFGLGAAWHEYEHEAYGIPFHTVRERLERLDEARAADQAALDRAATEVRGEVLPAVTNRPTTRRTSSSRTRRS